MNVEIQIGFNHGFRIYTKNKKDRIKFYDLTTSDNCNANNGEENYKENSTIEKLVLRLMKPYIKTPK